MRSIRKKTARWAVFAAVGNERSEATAAAAAENPFRRTKNTEAVFYCFGVFLIIIGRDSNKAGNTRDRCLRQMKGARVGAAVEKIEESASPMIFSGTARG